MPPWLPKVRVAACNVAPVFLDTAKTVQKTIGLIREAATNRADLVVFPEVYIPAYPLWVCMYMSLASLISLHEMQVMGATAPQRPTSGLHE
ncbi:hypothetical protein LTR37_012397 [Vermiconidia calcicola]|uniref:Uncharacterized protein n=1 Tax=Vermiconidia calcicola TaxID=1690605 RepID=A0ACC3MZI3_9PEZI|nr:hypothetical protein LTR37_012397 [Vermiconidia calcicola]